MVTDHTEYKEMDLVEVKKGMRTPIIVEGRKVFDKKACILKGFIYRGVGR